MVTAGLLMVAQAGSGTISVPACFLVTPRGDAVSFLVAGDEQPHAVRLAAMPGSAWPTTAVAGMMRASGPRPTIAVGTGPEGLMFEMGGQTPTRPQRSATLLLRQGERATLPVATGYCEETQVSDQTEIPAADSTDPGPGNPAFDPALWPSDSCALILSNRRRLRFTFTVVGRDRVRIAAPGFWSDQPITASINYLPSESGAQAGMFTHPAGIIGLQSLVTDASRGAKLIRFGEMGEATQPNLIGFGICGYSHIERRAQPS